MSDYKNYIDNKTNSTPVQKGPCDSCGSSDANVLFSDGHHYCFSCNTYKGVGNHNAQETLYDNGAYKQADFDWGWGALTDRKIKKETATKYGVRCEMYGDDVTHHEYPYYNSDGSLATTKIRDVATKDMWQTSGAMMKNAQLFGQQLFPKGGKFLTITEGECDAMAAYELTGSKFPVVSIKNGSSGAAKDIKSQFEYVDSFETIVLCFDNDPQGDKATKQVAALFEPKKVKIASLELKDANEYLKAGKFEEFTRCWWNAEVFTPAGIMNLGDLGDDLYDETDQETCLYPWDGLNDKLYGIRTGELVTFTAGTGTGKSSILRELMYHMLQETNSNIGVLALEENIKQTCFHLMSVPANDRLYLREVRKNYSREQLKEFEDKTISTRRFFAFDHFGSIDNDEILMRVRYMIKALDCRWIFLDHLSILVSGQEGTDERRSIDILMTKLRSLVEETNCALLLVSHLRRTSTDKGAEDGKEISLGHLRGSQAIAQLSDAVVALERDQQADDPTEANTTKVRVLKNRYAGDNGIATHLYFDKDTGRLTETEPELQVESEYADLMVVNGS
jgi:twinkle protein